MTDRLSDAAQAEQVRLATIEECARVAENYPSSGAATEHPVEHWIRALAAQPPAAPVETDGEKAARDYEHGYNDGVEWAQTHGRCSAGNAELISDIEYAITCAREDRANSAIEWLASMKRKYAKLATDEPQAAPALDEADPTFAAMVNAARDEHFRLKGFHPYTADVIAMLKAALAVTRPHGGGE